MVLKWDVTIPALTGDVPRTAYIYLPESYEFEPEKRYPVMYMFDGQNIFFDQDASFGKSWGMNDYMVRSGKQMIIVAVECNKYGQRFQEYSPFTYENREHGYVKGRGKLYMDWLVKELKPYIDENYRTLPDRTNTMIAGSSMGGLIALYGVSYYNRIFQRAACLSPSLWVDSSKAYNLIAQAKIKNDTTIYMDYGSDEMENHEATADSLISMNHLLLKKRVNLTFRIVPSGTHCEASWEQRIPIFMECLEIK